MTKREKIMSFVVFGIDITLAFFKKQWVLYKQERNLREALYYMKKAKREIDKEK